MKNKIKKKRTDGQTHVTTQLAAAARVSPSPLLHPLTLGALRRIIITRRNKMIGLCLSWLPPLAAAAAPVGNLVRSNSKGGGGRKLLRGEPREHEEHKAILSESLPTTTTTRSTFFYFY